MNSSGVLLFVLSFGHMCTDIVQGALPALLPFLKERFGLSYAVTGTLLMAAHLTSSVIQPFFGYVTDRRPFPILLPLGLIISGIGVALVPHSPSFGWLVAFVMFTGLGTAAFHPEGFKATACIVSERRATGMSLFSVGGNLGFAIGGPATIFLVSRYGLPGASALLLPAAAAALLYLPALPPIRLRIQSASSGPRGNAGNPVDRPLYAVSLIVMIVVLRSWTQLGLATYIPFLYQAQLKTDPGYVATLLFFFLVAGTVGTVVGGPLADRFGHRRYFTLSLLTVVPLAALFPYSRGLWAVLLLAVAGAIIVSSFAVTIAMGQTLMPGNLGMSSGLITGLAIGLGGVAVTGLGWIADRRGLMASMHVIPVLPLAGALLSLGIRMPPIYRGLRPKD